MADVPNEEGARRLERQAEFMSRMMSNLDGEKDAQIAALRDALSDTLNMLRAAHMQCGVHHDGNKRVIKARAVLKAALTPGSPQREA